MTIVVIYLCGLVVFGLAGMAIFCLSDARSDRRAGAGLFFLGPVWPLALVWFVFDVARDMFRELRRK